MLQTDWSARLDELLNLAHPLHAELGKPIGQRYYWTVTQSEFATDLCFKDKASVVPEEFSDQFVLGSATTPHGCAFVRAEQ